MNRLYQLYFLLPNFAKGGIFFGKILNKVMLIILKRLFDFFIPSYYKWYSRNGPMGITDVKRDVKYIVSLTSFPGRINEVWISIETIFRQSFKPDEIILWLAESQFPDRKLPDTLLNLTKRGLTIKYCDDLRSHKKYYYSLRNYPDCNIITLDDDLYYHKDVLKNLIVLQKKYPDCICTNRAHEILIENHEVLPYRQWRHNSVDIAEPSSLLLQTGGAGTLYPPRKLHADVFDKNLIKELSFHADDIWLYVMAYLKGTKIVTNRFYNKDFITIGQTQKEKLVSTNVIMGGNDEQLRNIISHYKIKIR
jgi:hypothetical protein